MLDIYLIRHAESEMNAKQHLISGRSNHTKLSEKGLLQAEKLRRAFESQGIVFDEVHASIAVRALDTALISTAGMGFTIDNIITSEEIVELSQGDWEGKERVLIYTPEQIALMNADHLRFQPPNGDSQQMVEDRMFDYIERIRKSHPETDLYNVPAVDKKIGVFSHGMAIRCLLRKIMDFSPKLTYRMITENTSISQIQYDAKGWKPIRINDAGHLLYS
jgi:broad specificity phosphatase PhoE